MVPRAHWGRAVRLAVLFAMVVSVTPMPKTSSTSAKADALSEKKKEAAKRRAQEQQAHPTVPRSRLRNTAGPVPLEDARQAKEAGSPAGKATGGKGMQAQKVPEEQELSASERAALVGGLLLAPAGIGGFLLGCSIGGGSVLLYEKMSKGMQAALADYKQKHREEVEGGFRSFASLAQLNEVTVKAATEEEAAALRERLEAVLEAESNRRCFDCTEVAEDMAAWASISLGVFLCPRCAGVHRAMGTDKSRIKSAVADVWTKEMIERMETLGNARAAELYGPAAAARVSKKATDEVLEAHIRDKYAKVKPAPGPLPAPSGKLYRCASDGEVKVAGEGGELAPAPPPNAPATPMADSAFVARKPAAPPAGAPSPSGKSPTSAQGKGAKTGASRKHKSSAASAKRPSKSAGAGSGTGKRKTKPAA